MPTKHQLPDDSDTTTLTGLSSEALLRDWASDQDSIYDDERGDSATPVPQLGLLRPPQHGRQVEPQHVTDP